MNAILLEHFRHDPIGLPLFSLTDKTKETRSVQASYIDYAFRAFYLTMEDIEQLEMAKGELVPDGRNSIVSATLWFLGLESYINTLLKLTCFHLNEDFGKYKTKSLAEKLSAILGLLQIDDLPVKKTGIHNRIHEFTVFRNEVFHDRNVGNPVKFNKTNFSEIPINCNLIDVMQGLLIFLEVTTLLRYSISGLDTMPDIFIHANNKAFTKKLDILYSVLVKPSLEAVLAKHKLSTNLNLEGNSPEPIKSNVFSQGKVITELVADSPRQYYYSLNSDQTYVCRDLFVQLVDGEDVSPDKFRIGKYMIPDS